MTERALGAKYKAIADEILALEEEYAERQGDGEERSSAPRPAASAAAIAKAERALKRKLPSSFVELLKVFDGWDHFSWGLSIFGTRELSDASRYADAREVFGYGDDPIPDELERGVLIAQDENDATRVLLLESGEVVDWMYEERERYPDVAAFLSSRKGVLLDMAARAREARERLEREWSAAYRSESDRALEVEAAEALKRAGPAPIERLAAVKRPWPKAAKATELVAKKGRSVVAEVGLGVVLYLGAAPTRDEVFATIRAFREHFPFKGKLQWMRASSMEFFPHDARAVDDESFFDALRADDEGHFGLRLELALAKQHARAGSKNTAFLNVRAVPPELDEEDAARLRAAFVELYLPAHADADALAALVRALTDVLPVRSGHGGYFAHVWDRESEPDPNRAVFEWCRRFWGIDVVGIDGWLSAALRRMRGASWLTVVGRPFLRALDGAGALGALPSEVSRHDGAHGAVFQAGAAPSLCDVARGEACEAVASVARAIDPLVVQSYEKRGFFSVGGVLFDTFQEELPAFVDHHATALHVHRFARPASFQGPTPREEAEAMMRALCEEHGTRFYKEWLSAKKRGDDDGFRDVLRGLYNAACGDAVRTELGLEALGFLTRFPEWAPAQTYGNFFYALLHRGAYAEALEHMPEALRIAAESNPPTFHNAACIFAKSGDPERALECVALAKKHGYEGFARMKDDEDLATIARRPEFLRLFE